MKRLFFAIAAMSLAFLAAAQPKAKFQGPDYEFTTVKANPVTSVKNQYRSGTCWCFSTLSFLESEIIRINGIKDEAAYPDLSEFFVVSHSYSDRADKYVRVEGKLGFSAGSEAGDVLHVIKDYGIVPQDAMSGMNYGTELPVQGELDSILKGYVDAVVANPNKKLSTAWKRGYDAVLREYLGEYPEKFTVGGKEYTPESWRDALKLNPDDYVTLASFTHHPFNESFIIEIRDNWRWDSAYNVSLDDFMAALDHALENGYTAAWGTDVSDPGFTRDGLAILIDTQAKAGNGSDQEHWVGKEEGKEAKVDPNKEREATQETHQRDFDNQSVTDDHGMHIYGIARDQYGKKYYMVKNSWGETGKYKGIWYATESFVKNQSLDIVLHKDALPKDLKKKLGIK